MKFITPIVLALAVAGTISMTSCSKKYTCHCNLVYSGTPGLPDSSSTEYTIQNNKSGAQSVCNAQSGTYINNNITTVETCYLY